MKRAWWAGLACVVGCAAAVPGAGVDASGGDAGIGSDAGDGAGATEAAVGGNPFADHVVAFAPGAHAGFGQALLPGVVLGPPDGKGANAGSLHVVSLGKDGVITLEFTDVLAVDGPGPDLVVFENPFSGWVETGHVAASLDGKTWHEWPCAAKDPGHAGCSGVAPVLSSPGNGVDPTDPKVAGGDAFDLQDIGLKQARFVRIRDSGLNAYEGTTGGFDLDAVAVVNGAPVP